MPEEPVVVTTPERSRLMSKVKQADTRAEVLVRKLLDELGIRYRTNVKGLPGTPDILNYEEKWVIFVNGCFWHAHEGCIRSKLPKSNRLFWERKQEENKRRDKANLECLQEIGFLSLTIWECELRNAEILKRKIRDFLTEPEPSRKTDG